MTLSTEPSPAVDAAGLPADPTAYRRGGGFRLWIIVLGAFLWTVAWVAAALYVASIGRPAGQAAQSPAAISNPFAARAPEAAPAEPAAPATAPQPVIASEPPANAALAARLERVEIDQRRATESAAAALAAASLAEAAQSAAPFDAELTAIGHLLPATTDLRTLQRLARQGAPTRAALAAEFSDTAARAASAARTTPDGSGFLARMGQALSRIVTIRRIDDTSGDGADAILNRAQHELEDGDLEAAVADLDKLSPPARQALAGWRERAQRRLEIDRQIAAIRTAAMRELSLSAGGRS
jgi:hypothetical protein